MIKIIMKDGTILDYSKQGVSEIKINIEGVNLQFPHATKPNTNEWFALPEIARLEFEPYHEKEEHAH